MTPRQWGTVLFTVMGIVLIATGGLLGLTILTQMGGSELLQGVWWRIIMLIGVPIGGGFALLAMRELLAAKYLRDEPVQPSAMRAPDAVRVGIVLYGVLLMVGSALGFVLAIVTGHDASWLRVRTGSDDASFRSFLGCLIQLAAGFLLATRSRALTEVVWRE